MTILFVWAYGRVLDPTLCLFTGSCCDIVATPWIGDVLGPAVLHRIYERERKHFLAQILILRVLGICLQWLEAFEYSVGAICRLVGPQVVTVLWGKYYFPLKTSTSYIAKAVIT